MLNINTNISAQNAHTHLLKNDQGLTSSREKLASGLRINRAADDAAGLAISSQLLTQVLGSSQAQSNAQDGVSLLNTTDGALSNVGDALQQLRTLAVQAANGTNSPQDLQALDAQAQSLLGEINSISANTSFNGQQTLSAAVTNLTLQTGADNGQTNALSITGTDTATLGLGGFSLATQAGAQAGISALDAAIGQVDANRTNIGASTNQLYHTIDNLGVSNVNQLAARSQIRDTDMAAESTKNALQQILTQSGTAMLAQANFKHQNILRLLA